MISRRTTLTLGELFANHFSKVNYGGGRNSQTYYTCDTQELYDFLFQHEYEAYLLNIAEGNATGHYTRAIEKFVMQLHTGETILSATKDWEWDDRRRLGNRILYDLAADILSTPIRAVYKAPAGEAELRQKLRSDLELDGYTFKDGRLLYSEASVVDTEEEEGVLDRLAIDLKLPDYKTVRHHLDQSVAHYNEGRWDDCISNSRKVLESVLAQCVLVHSTKVKGSPLPKAKLERPVDVREYLEQEKLLETKEKKALAEVYGLLSNTGGHPYIAAKEQARLMRHLALTFTQFVLLRLQGSLQSAGVVGTQQTGQP